MIEIHGKEIPETLEELVDPAKTAVLVIDMQNDACSEGGLLHRLGGDLSLYPPAIRSIRELLSAARELGVTVIHTQHTVLPGHVSESPAHLRFIWHLTKSKYGSFGDDLTIDGTWGQEFVEELKPSPGEVVLKKHRSSAFVGTGLESLLRSNGLDRLIVTGCVTEGCIECTAREAEGRDFFVVISPETLATDIRDHHEAALKNMSIRFEFAKVPDIIEVWRRDSAAKEEERQVATATVGGRAG